MRKVKKGLIYVLSWFTSVGYLIYWIIAYCFKSDFKNHVKRNKQGAAIDIIVNGPSFSKQKDYVKNDGYEKCMVNYAINSSIFWELKPSYYCVSDPKFFRIDTETPNKETQEAIENLRKVDWEMTFFVSYYNYKNYIKNSELNELKCIKFVPFHSISLPLSFEFKKIAFWLFRAGKAMPNPESVSIPALMNALNSGFTEIHLYGYDHDWIHNVVVDEDNRVCLHDTHFYKQDDVLRPWWKNAEHTETFTMCEILQSQNNLFEAYRFIREYSDYLKNVKIYNMSSTSLIDAFQRKQIPT